MKKILIALIMFCSFGWSIDPLFVYFGVANDKSMHGAFSYMATDILEDDWGYEWWESAVILGLIGVAKETVDVMTGGSFDKNDIGANYAGWLVYRLIKFEWEF